MAYLYAMSDIHQELVLFQEMLTLVDWSEDNKLILLGDYIDIHAVDPSILYFIKELQDKHKDQVIVIAGNHELLFLEEIQSKARSFHDRSIIKWLGSLPFYYETPTQIFVHAGVDEEAEDFWKWGSENYYFCSKYPHTTGKFYKDIIAGHVSTSEITGIADYHKVYWDRHSHYYVDGDVRVSQTIPLLKYDTISGNYSSFEKKMQKDGILAWQEYMIK